MEKQTSIKANFSYNLIYSIINIIVPLITAPYTSRVLGAANIGIYSYTYSYVSTVIMLGALGTSTYGQKEISAVRNDVEQRSTVFWEVYIVRIAATLIAILLFVPFMYSSGYLKWFLIEIPFFIAALFDVSWFFQGMEQFKLIAVRNALVRVAGVVLLLLLVKTDEHLWIYLLIIGLSQLIGNMTYWPYLKGRVIWSGLSWNRIVKHFKGALVYFIPSIAYQIYAVLDKAMLGLLVGSDYENGYYEQAYKIINMIITVFTSYTVVMRSRMSYLFAKKDYSEIKSRMEKSGNFIAFLVFPMAAGLAATARGLVPWFFGEGYDQVVILLIIFSPIIIFMGYVHLLGTHLLTPSGRQRKSNIAQCVAAVANVIMNAVLIPIYYSAGAAIASVLSQLIILIIYFRHVRREYTVLDAFRTGWKKIVSALIMFIVVYTVQIYLPISIFSSMIEVGIGVVVYICVLLIIRDEFTRTSIVNVLKNVEDRFHKN